MDRVSQLLACGFVSANRQMIAVLPRTSDSHLPISNCFVMYWKTKAHRDRAELCADCALGRSRLETPAFMVFSRILADARCDVGIASDVLVDSSTYHHRAPLVSAVGTGAAIPHFW